MQVENIKRLYFRGKSLRGVICAMSGEKLTDEEVLASHKIIPLRGEPR